MFAPVTKSWNFVSCDVFPVTDMAQLIFKIKWHGEDWKRLKTLDNKLSSAFLYPEFTRQITDKGVVTWRNRTNVRKMRILYQGYRINAHIHPIDQSRPPY